MYNIWTREWGDRRERDRQGRVQKRGLGRNRRKRRDGRGREGRREGRERWRRGRKWEEEKSCPPRSFLKVGAYVLTAVWWSVFLNCPSYKSRVWWACFLLLIRPSGMSALCPVKMLLPHPTIWNVSPLSVKDASTVSTFKHQLQSTGKKLHIITTFINYCWRFGNGCCLFRNGLDNFRSPPDVAANSLS